MRNLRRSDGRNEKESVIIVKSNRNVHIKTMALKRLSSAYFLLFLVLIMQ